MKEIKAYIKKHKLAKVTKALQKLDGLTGMSIIDCSGYGKSWGAAKVKASDESDVSRPGVKIEVICHDHLAELVVTYIEQAAHTGLKGDGKIYIGDISMAVRVSTGERGEKAI